MSEGLTHEEFARQFLPLFGFTPEIVADMIESLPDGIRIKGSYYSKKENKTVWKTVMYLKVNEAGDDFVFDIKDLTGRYKLSMLDMVNQIFDVLNYL